MIPLPWLLLAILASPFKSKRQLEAENVALRHLTGQSWQTLQQQQALQDTE
jgi:hypothetical protein